MTDYRSERRSLEKLSTSGFIIDDWQVSPAEGALLRAGEEVHLEPKVMEVLVYFASRPSEVITREELERDVWRGALVGYDSVTATVIKLRKALGDNAKQPRIIATIPKRGYQLIAPLTYPDDNNHVDTTTPLVNEAVAKLPPGQHPHPVRYKVAIMVAMVGMVIIGLLWLMSVRTPPADEASSGLPSIVVLPFENLGDDVKQEYLADGLTDDIITDLSRLSNLLVIASNTSFTYKGRQSQSQEVGTELKVNFVLKGSIRRIGDAVRINAQLVNAKTGFNLWAQRYDRKVVEVFAVQDEVTSRIVEALAVKLTDQEKQRLANRTTNNLAAYDFFQQGQRISKVSTKEASEQAQDVYRKAIELDPAYGRAYGALAYTLAFDFRRGWTDSPLETLDRALELGKKAVVLDDSIPQTHWALGYVYLMRKEYDNAEKSVAQAISIAPSYADAYGLLALIKNNLGQAEKAIEFINKGMRLNPYYTWDYLYNLGCANYMLGHYDTAVAALERAQARNENVIPIKLYLAASYVKANRLEDAEWTVEQLLMLNPATTLSHTEKTIPIVNPEIMRTLLTDLRRAGLPE